MISSVLCLLLFIIISKKGAFMATTLALKVIPQAGKQELLQTAKGVVTCRLKSPPEDGKANAELVKFLAKKLAIPQADVRIIQGQTSRKKVIAISSLDEQTMLQRLGIEQQQLLSM
jgi:uncharacterized protein (TIGR00251 family)